ncbi:MAG TPA: hypothetical protein VK206_21240, partial [Anaerolineales bacterium]|nr:hypothetical protein [Anaerolineales bacterium]
VSENSAHEKISLLVIRVQNLHGRREAAVPVGPDFEIYPKSGDFGLRFIKFSKGIICYQTNMQEGYYS